MELQTKKDEFPTCSKTEIIFLEFHEANKEKKNREMKKWKGKYTKIGT